MSWKFVPDDEYDYDNLVEIKKFFESDLKAAKAYKRELVLMFRDSKLSKSRQRWALNQAQKDISVSKSNLSKVEKAIENVV